MEKNITTVIIVLVGGFFIYILLNIITNSNNSIVTPSTTETVSDMTWYSPESITNDCKERDGPSNMIEMLQTLKKPYNAVEDKKVGDVVVQLTLQMPSEGRQITYFRGRDRCEAAVASKKAAEKFEVDKYK